MTVHHPVFARAFERVSRAMDAGGFAELRVRLLDGLSGTVVDVGAGNGLNFPHYPATVEHVIAVEPEPYLRRRAEADARTAPIPIDVVDGTAEHLPLPDRSCEAVVFSLVLCSVADQPRALAEAFRVLRPGGRLGVSDIVAEDELTADQRAERGSHVGCVAGALPTREYRDRLASAGFVDISITLTTHHPVAQGMHSAIIRAAKPAVTCCGVVGCCAPGEHPADLALTVEQAKHAAGCGCTRPDES